MRHAAPGSRPTESLFYLPLVYLIGRLSSFKPYIGVDHTKVRDDVLRLAGFTLITDDKGTPTHATDGTSTWPLKSTSSKARDGLYRVVHFAWYHQTQVYRLQAKARCASPVKGLNGEWALTALGADEAKQLRELYDGQIQLSSGPNVTAQFLGENFERFYPRMTSHLRRKMKRSEMFDKVDDHAMNWISKVIERDGLRSRIEAHKPIAPSQVCAWARRGAYSDIRNEGREPVARVLHGAMTPKEVRVHSTVNWTEEVIPRTINDSEGLSGMRVTAHREEEGAETDSIQYLMDTHSSASVEETVGNQEAFKFCLERVSEILHEEISQEHDPDWHEQLVHDRFIKEMSVREIADAHGLSFEKDQNRIKTALLRVRDVMRRAREEGEFDDLVSR
jgi:DNA-directed RNA polymerase specialized sigma24 family protein